MEEPVAHPIITLTTDFGTADAYVGVMKGVILGINPQAVTVDISHHIQPQSVQEGAFIIGTSHRFFPQGTVHIVVVDPGVGTSRSAILLVTRSASFLAPDNGVLSYVLREGFRQEPEVSERSEVPLPDGYRAYRLKNEEFWLHPVSSTFHGRDVFAPVAAHLSLGVPAHRLGEEVYSLTWLTLEQPQWDGDTLVGEVAHVDRFGNLITNIPAGLLPSERSIAIDVKGRRIAGLSPSYSNGPLLLALVGSHGNLEVSVKNGSAAQSLEAKVGDPVRVEAAQRAVPS